MVAVSAGLRGIAVALIEGTGLRDAALALGVSEADFDRIVDPKTMVGDPRHDLGVGA
jgi:hypothetical protein